MSSPLDSLSSLPPSPPPSPPSPPSYSTNLSLLLIFFLLVLIIIITISIHLLLRFVSQHPIPSPSLMHLNSISSSTSISTSMTSSSFQHTSHYDALVDSLPIFTLSTLPFRPSTDCAVCLSRFRPDDKLRLLPACRHAFHSACIDKWLHSTPSCPLCRSSIECQLQPPLPSPPTATAIDEATLGQWLKEYVDRLASAATTPFSSLRFSACGSRRFDFEEGSADGRSVSLEMGEESFRSSDSGYFASVYKWMAMARE